MKKMVFVMLLFLVFTSNIFATEVITVVLDGNYVDFDTNPVIEEGTTLVPIRAIVEALGSTVEWNAELQQIIITRNQTHITLTIQSTTASINGHIYKLAKEPKIINDRTYVPLRFIAENFGLVVKWEAETNTVVITSNHQISNDSVLDDNIKDISLIDTNGNGIVTIAEAKAAGYSMPIDSSHWLYPYMIDRDHDGFVGE